MKLHLTSLLRRGVAAAALLFTLTAAPLRAGFFDGQRPDIVLGTPKPATSDGRLHSIAVDAARRKVYVSFSQRDQVCRYSWEEAMRPGGVPEAVFGENDPPLAAATAFDYPQGLCLDPAGRLYVADYYNHRVLRFDAPWSAASGAAASAVLGQPGWGQNAEGAGAAQMQNPDYLAHDGSALYVLDSGNNRVLRFDNAAAKPSGSAANAVLTISAADSFSTYGLAIERATPQASPRLWLGLNAFASGGIKTSRIVWWNNAHTIASGTQPHGSWGVPHSQNDPPSSNTLNSPAGIACDAAGGWLYVADDWDDRILRLNTASITGALSTADGVLGQPALNTRGSGHSLRRLYSPANLAFVEIDGVKQLLAVDAKNERLLCYASPQTAPNGAPAHHGVGGMRLYSLGLARHEATGLLFVSDRTNGLIHRFRPVPGTGHYGPAPNVTFGRSVPGWLGLDEPADLAITAAGQLIVADSENHRILLYNGVTGDITDSHAPAGVLGQASGAGKTSGTGLSQLHHPLGLAWDAATGTLWAADMQNHRVLGWKNALNRFLALNKTADFIRGTTATPGTTGSLLKYPQGVAIGQPAAGGNPRLYVADTDNHRVLFWDLPENLAANGSAAHGLMGQANFTTASPNGPLPSPQRLVAAGVNPRLYITSGYPFAEVAPVSCFRQTNIAQPIASIGHDSKETSGGWINNAACAIAVDSAGHVWLADGMSVLRYNNQAQPVVSFSITVNNKPRLIFLSEPGIKYHVQQSDDLVSWTKGGEITGFSLNSTSWTSSQTVNVAPRRFFRAVEP